MLLADSHSHIVRLVSARRHHRPGRRTGGCGAGDDGAAAEDPPPFDPSKVWVDGLRKIRLKTATFGKMADPEEDRVNPIRPEQWPEDDAPTTVQRLATEIRAGIITKEMMSKMSWAIVYGGVRLGHSVRRLDTAFWTAPRALGFPVALYHPTRPCKTLY